jgi:hypothetical protein
LIIARKSTASFSKRAPTPRYPSYSSDHPGLERFLTPIDHFPVHVQGLPRSFVARRWQLRIPPADFSFGIPVAVEPAIDFAAFVAEGLYVQDRTDVDL